MKPLISLMAIAVVGALFVAFVVLAGGDTEPVPIREQAPPRAALADSRAALEVARGFAVSHSRYLFGQVPVRAIKGAAFGLLRELAAFEVPRSAARESARIRLLRLVVRPRSLTAALATGKVNATGTPAWPVAFEMAQVDGRWFVVRLLSAE